MLRGRRLPEYREEKVSSAQTKSGSAQSRSAVQKEYEEGKRLLESGDYGQAALSLHNALVGFEQRKDDNGIANACNQLGHLCTEKGDYQNALQHYQRAFTICDAANDRMSVLAVLVRRLEVYVRMEEYDKAVADCLAMLDLYQDNRDPQGAVGTLERLAEVYLAAGEKQKAADSYRVIAGIHKNYRHDAIAASFLEKADALAG